MEHLSQYYEYEVKYNEEDKRKRDYHILKRIKEYEQPKKKAEIKNLIYSKKIIEVIKEDNIQTAKNVSRIIKDDEEILALKHSDGTIYEYTRVRMRNMFGTKVNEGGTEILEDGTKGYISEKIWCRLDKDNNFYIELETEVVQEFRTIMKGLKEEQEEYEMEIISDYESGLISKEEMKEAISNNTISCYLQAKEIFHKKYQFYPIKVPVYEFGLHFTE